MGRIDAAEERIHGRRRDLQSMQWSNNKKKNNNKANILGDVAEEARFGVLHEPVRLAKGKSIPDAQWTGVVTGIALSMLESGQVDAVVCIASSDRGDDDDDQQFNWSSPEPILARTSEDVLRGRGVKPALAPSLRLLDEIQQDSSIRNLLFCGVGCGVQAFRAIQDDLDLDNIYVLGTNCVDNSPSPEAAQRFLQEGVQIDTLKEKVRGYEFMQDYKVHVKTQDGYVKKPYFCLPGTIALPSIATSCLACFDYTNGLADVVVGYMGAPLAGARMDESYQTLTVRNERGSRMVQTAIEADRLHVGEVAWGSGSHEKLASATVASDSIVLDMVGGKIPEKGMPLFMGNILAFVLSNVVGPKGINFARYSIDYHILRNYLHVLQEWGEERAHKTMPQFARDIVAHYVDSIDDDTMSKLKRQIQSTTRRSK